MTRNTQSIDDIAETAVNTKRSLGQRFSDTLAEYSTKLGQYTNQLSSKAKKAVAPAMLATTIGAGVAVAPEEANATYVNSTVNGGGVDITTFVNPNSISVSYVFTGNPVDSAEDINKIITPYTPNLNRVIKPLTWNSTLDTSIPGYTSAILDPKTGAFRLGGANPTLIMTLEYIFPLSESNLEDQMAKQVLTGNITYATFNIQNSLNSPFGVNVLVPFPKGAIDGDFNYPVQQSIPESDMTIPLGLGLVGILGLYALRKDDKVLPEQIKKGPEITFAYK